MEYTIYTDGAYSRLHDEGAFAFVILNEAGGEVLRMGHKVVHETNNRAELKAIIAAVYKLPKDATKARIISDSMYALNTLQGIWARNINHDLFEVWERTISDKSDVELEFLWVKGHSGDEYNELCDQLCNQVLGYDANAEFAKYKKNK